MVKLRLCGSCRLLLGSLRLPFRLGLAFSLTFVLARAAPSGHQCSWNESPGGACGALFHDGYNGFAQPLVQSCGVYAFLLRHCLGNAILEHHELFHGLLVEVRGCIVSGLYDGNRLLRCFEQLEIQPCAGDGNPGAPHL